MNKKRDTDTSTAFLDIICCAFGAVILLIILLDSNSGATQNDNNKLAQQQIRELQLQIFEVQKQITAKQKQLTIKTETIAQLKSSAIQAEQSYQAEKQMLQQRQQQLLEQNTKLRQMQIAKQQLSAEMKQLELKPNNSSIGGIPVDSQYIIFIIDTSGSMVSNAWQRVQTEINDILKVYPTVKGIQVMNDMGEFMFNNSSNDWLTDSRQMRQKIIDRLNTWRPHSNSSPVEGITSAINGFYDKNKKISLYIFGDDFGGNINAVTKFVQSINKTVDNSKLVRIHAIGMPVSYYANGRVNNKFAALMRKLAEDNAGAFIGLNSQK